MNECCEFAMIYTPLWDIDNGETLCTKCHDKTKKERLKNVNRKTS